MPLTSSVWESFKLRQGTTEPGTFRIGTGGGAAVLTGVITSANLDTLLREGVESAVADNENGQITRTLPVAHPAYPWMFLRAVDNVQGISFIEKLAADPEGTLEAPAMPYYSDYAEYQIQATFEPRTYVQSEDSTLERETITYYGENDEGFFAQTDGDPDSQPIEVYVWPEWWRYTEWFSEPAAEYLTAEIGQLTWSSPGGSHPASPADKSGVQHGTSRFIMPSTTWKINWYAVPYNYVLSVDNYFIYTIGRVNQLEWEGFAPGSALLLAVTVLRVYPTPFPEFTEYEGFNVVGQDKLCDLQFTILEVNRTAGISVVPVSRNHIAAGHNCLPYRMSRKYFYAENFRGQAAPGTGEPTYPSYPFQLLFQNPDWDNVVP